jgi:hypothetical protein
VIDGPLHKKVKVTDCLLNAIVGVGDSNVEGNVPALWDGRADDDDDGTSNPRVVNVFDTVGLIPKEVNVNVKLRAIVKVKRSI